MSWKSLESALAAVDPEHCHAFAPGASAEALAVLEIAIGRRLPDAFRRAWSIHDGMRQRVFTMLEFLSTRQIAGEWHQLRDYDGMGDDLDAEVEGPVKQMWTNVCWIPFVLIGGETRHFCLDLDPAPGGEVGQVIHATPKWDERRVVAPSVDAFLELIAHALREGRYEIDDEIDVCEALRI
jgi:cell wall assembly regulator SMI1